MIARHVVAGGDDPARVASTIVESLRAPDLRCAFVFADWRLDPGVIAREVHRGLAPAPVVGGTTIGVIAPEAPAHERAAVALGLYGDWLRVGIGIANDLPKAALARGRDAVQAAAAALGTTGERLDSAHHTAVTLCGGNTGHEEAFCIGSAAAAPRIRFVGGAVACEEGRKPHAWANGEVLTDAAVVVVLDSELPTHAVTSSHLVPTELKTVVTATSGRRILELDGHPAGARFGSLVDPDRTIDRERPSHYAFARYIEGIPYVRSIVRITDAHIDLASAVEVGHVLRIMRAGDLIGQTTRDLAVAADKVGGTMSAFLAFSCIGRHWEAATGGLESQLAAVYAAYPTAGFQSYGEQSGMQLVNHTLTGLAIWSAAVSDEDKERVADLEAELAAAQRTIDVLIARLERTQTQTPTQSELFDTAVRLGHVLEERTREVEDARAEFRALRANLDQIVRQRTRALAESEAQLRAKNAELHRQSLIKAEFISIAAHELRTPLTSIVGYLDLFSEGRFGELPPLIARPMASVRRNAHRLKRLVHDMLDVSRIEGGKMTLRRESVDLGDVVRDVVTELLPLANARKQKLETHIERINQLDADRDKLHQIAVNLVSNAIRYTPDQGEIAVHVDEAPSERYPGGWARLRVRDNGVGIAEADRQRIFYPFLHAQPAKHHTSQGPDSAGLGLYIARGLIELHGGLITVDSTPDVGTEFTVLLPFKHSVRASSEPSARAI